MSLVRIRNPFELANWTLPVLEAMMVCGALLALWWSIRRLRRDGDPVNLALWAGSIVYLLVTEIPLYFPAAFGIEDRIGVVFHHGLFTVQFLDDNLPLYIVALYPALTTLAYEIVRSLGVFGLRRGVLLGAVCVGFVHHCFYEVFDQLGPQLHWWEWITANPLNRPMLASVPMTSVYIFATLGPAVLTVLVLVLVGRRPGLTLPGLAWRTVVAGAAVIFGVAALCIPTSLFSGHPTAQAMVFAIELAAFAAVAIPVLVRQWRSGAAVPNPFVRIFGPLYLGVLAVLWIAAVVDGPPTGSVPYAAACFVLASFAVVSTLQIGVQMSRSKNGSLRAAQVGLQPDGRSR